MSQILIQAKFKTDIYSSLAPRNIFNIAVRQQNIFEFNNHDAYTWFNGLSQWFPYFHFWGKRSRSFTRLTQFSLTKKLLNVQSIKLWLASFVSFPALSTVNAIKCLCSLFLSLKINLAFVEEAEITDFSETWAYMREPTVVHFYPNKEKQS